MNLFGEFLYRRKRLRELDRLFKSREFKSAMLRMANNITANNQILKRMIEGKQDGKGNETNRPD